MRISFLGILFIFFSASASALDVPPPPEQYVTDRAGVLSASTIQLLNQYLYQYEKKTGSQVVVAVFSSLEGDSLEDFSIRLATAWKAGQEGKDNGVVFLVFIQDRAARIEVGYGLEGLLPDITARQILARDVFPYFKQGKWDEGVKSGVKSIVSVITDPNQTTSGVQKRRSAGPDKAVVLMVFLIICVIISIFDLFRYSRYVSQTGGRSDRYRFLEWWVRLSILLALLHFLLRFLLHAMVAAGRGGGGGGFSGGGGRFGGGGASGRW